ncbi:hypothetical protein H257_00249 [Aphanomyces astaci]|uniref:DDE Tnp4 domain-containing protein n=1 Tax=Aphanomyces astaci TaxID=112090 RepID=W4H9N3_APHAT|nr:hypothetical protein H257_00249 [Aphanomyces astaci]ETV88735.1 hypothetical protein H257_00249 [Aphanomyces astaci]|eukprot:XP_009821135.1 hypothetical protein H257_00249 [Aphanomyces astaci]
MPINANAVLNRLQDQSIRDRSYLDVEYGSNDEVNLEEVAANPIMERFTTDLGTDGIRALTNFTVSEFEFLWSFVDDAINNAWMEGRGHRCATSPKEALFMALTVLKHYCTWEKHAVDFGFKAPTLQKLIMRVLAVRGKHSFYGYKIEAAVSPDGRCVAMSASHPGSVHDLTIMHSRVKDHEANLAKSPSDAALPWRTVKPIPWIVGLPCRYGVYWHPALLAWHPSEASAGKWLAGRQCDLERNHAISSDRVIVENFFGRVCSLWQVSYSTFTWSEKNYTAIPRMTFALTYFHLSLMPLRREDEAFYGLVMARYQRMASEKKRKKAEAQRRYRMNRQDRAAMDAFRIMRFP